MLDKRLSTIPQHHWINKLFGFDFQVEYKPGRLNTVADALSRRDSEELLVQAISTPTFNIFEEVCQFQASSPTIQSIRAEIEAGTRSTPWAIQNNIVTRGGRVFLPSDSTIVQTALRVAHTAAHEGTQKTLHRLRASFSVDHDRRLEADYVRTCLTCQRNKTKALQLAGLLQPLPVPSRVWADISMDFVEALPKFMARPWCSP